MAGLTSYEKETIILTNEEDKFFTFYTFNPSMKKRLSEYAAKCPEFCELTASTPEGSETYKIDKSKVSIRFLTPYSAEQKEAARERAKTRGFGRKEN